MFLSFVINLFVSNLMRNGKRCKAEKILFETLREVKKSTFSKKFLNEKSYFDSHYSSVFFLKRKIRWSSFLDSSSFYKDSFFFYPLLESLLIVRPFVEVRSLRLGGSICRVPVEIVAERQFALGARWIVQSAKSRKDFCMSKKLAKEIDDIRQFSSSSLALKKRDEFHRLAEANRVFAYLRCS